MKQVALNDESHFALVSGLWKGERSPLKSAKVLRGTNFGGDGLLDFDDVVDLEVEERHFAERKLAEGDIIVERSGGGPKQPVGRVALFTPPDERPYFSSNFTTTLRVRDRTVFDPDYVALYLHALYLGGATETLQRATTGIRNLDWREYLRFKVPAIPLDAQKDLAHLIGGVRKAHRNERELIDVLVSLKQAAMRELFTRGLRGEAQKETEIGLVPESWAITTLGELCNNGQSIIQTGPFGSQLHAYDYQPDGVAVINPTHLVGNKVNHDDLPHISKEKASSLSRHLLQAGDILFARRGEIGRLGLIGEREQGSLCGTGCFLVRVKHKEVHNPFLAHSFGTRPIVEWLEANAAGAIMPNLNNVVLAKLPVACPSKDEQHEIVVILDALDRKIALHRQKRAVLEELFQSLLHKLMTGEIRVGDLDLSALGSKPFPHHEPGSAEPKGDFPSSAAGDHP
ncbi:MAG: restriction endonuclease subunit S [Candidatus Accumulibacter sp.]|nr:restriction endonuclease subunit S [Accumulibacter sp.]